MFDDKNCLPGRWQICGIKFNCGVCQENSFHPFSANTSSTSTTVQLHNIFFSESRVQVLPWHFSEDQLPKIQSRSKTIREMLWVSFVKQETYSICLKAATLENSILDLPLHVDSYMWQTRHVNFQFTIFHQTFSTNRSR